MRLIAVVTSLFALSAAAATSPQLALVKPMALVKPTQAKPAHDETAATDDLAIPVEAPPPPVRAHKTPDRYKDGLFVSVGAGGGFAASGPLRLGGSTRLSVGYIHPALVHLGVTFDPSLQFAWNPQTTSAGALNTQGLFVALPILASANFVLGPGLIRVLIGPSFDYIQLKATGTGSSAADEGWYFGMEAGVSYLFNLPVGLLGLDARFHFSPYHYLGSTTDGLLFSIGAAYAFTI